MAQDEIIKEVRAIREAYAERFGFDVRALYRDAKEREERSKRQVVFLEPKPAEPAVIQKPQSARTRPAADGRR